MDQKLIELTPVTARDCMGGTWFGQPTLGMSHKLSASSQTIIKNSGEIVRTPRVEKSVEHNNRMNTTVKFISGSKSTGEKPYSMEVT